MPTLVLSPVGRVSAAGGLRSAPSSRWTEMIAATRSAIVGCVSPTRALMRARRSSWRPARRRDPGMTLVPFDALQCRYEWPAGFCVRRHGLGVGDEFRAPRQSAAASGGCHRRRAVAGTSRRGRARPSWAAGRPAIGSENASLIRFRALLLRPELQQVQPCRGTHWWPRSGGWSPFTIWTISVRDDGPPVRPSSNPSISPRVKTSTASF